MMRTLTEVEWWAEGHRRFGSDVRQFRFICPSCQHVTRVQDWKDAGAPEGAIAFSCVGRYLGDIEAAAKNTFKGRGGPCDYTGGGLIGLNPVKVVFDDGRDPIRVFDFAEQEVATPLGGGTP